MEENTEMQMIPYFVHESDMARAQKNHESEMERVTEDKERLERVNKRFFIVILVLIALFVATNAFWIWRDSQFVDQVTETIETSTEGGGNAYGTIVSGDNSEVNYGESEGHTDKDPNP